MRMILAGLGLALALTTAASASQDITLNARNGALSIAGRFISYDGEYFRLETEWGPLTVDAEGVICEGPACPDLLAPVARIRIAGAGDIGLRLLPELMAAFAASRGLDYAPLEEDVLPRDHSLRDPQLQERLLQARITDPAGGQTLARIELISAPRAAGLAALEREEIDLLLDWQSDSSLKARALGLEPLVPAIGRGNPLPRLTTAQLASALRGEIDNWSAVGGPDRPIVVHGLVPEHPFQIALEARINAKLVDGPRHADANALSTAIANDPWALGLVGQSQLGDSRSPELTDACGFPLQVDDLSIKAEDYPLVLPLFLLAPTRRLPLMTRELLEFLSTPAGLAAIGKSGLIDRGPRAAPLSQDGKRLLSAIQAAGPEINLAELQRLGDVMRSGQRHSLSFRFNDGSSQLDAHSRDNLEDFARALSSGAFGGEVLTLVGFSDGAGAAAVNLALSRNRAEAVRAALQAAAPELTPAQLPRIEAFGEALPIACDNTAIGRHMNRRVELWSHPPAPEAAAAP